MNKRNQKVLDILQEMRRQWTLTAMKGLLMSVVAAPLIVLGCVLAGVEHTAAPDVIGVFTVFYIAFTYTGPRYSEISKEYRAKALEELEKIKNENPNSADLDDQLE